MKTSGWEHMQWRAGGNGGEPMITIHTLRGMGGVVKIFGALNFKKHMEEAVL